MVRRRAGFTLIEVIVIITVIAILATIATLGLNRYLEDGRDTQRQASVTTISEALEKYYDRNGEYPGCALLTQSPEVISGSVFQGIDQAVFLSPRAGDSATSSLSCTSAPSASTDIYQYQGDGSATCSTRNACLRYTLRYFEETTGEIVSLNSRRTVALSTSGTPTLTASGSGFTTLSTSWTEIPGTERYEVHVSRVASFSPLTTTAFSTTTSASISSGLSYDTSYYVRVRAVNGSNQGAWSNVVQTSTRALTAPSLTISPVSASSASATWSAVSGSSGYVLERSTDESSWTATNTTSTSSSQTGLSGATLYYYRVKAVWNSNQGPWSSTVSSYTNPANPTGLGISAAMSGNSAVGTAIATCESGQPQYQLRTRNTNTTTAGTWSSWSAWANDAQETVSSTAQGYQYGFQMQARCMLGTTPSGAVSLATVATTVRDFDAPGTPSVSASTSGDTTTFTRGSVTCSGNGTAEYRYRRSQEGTYYSYSSATTINAAATNTASQGWNYGMNWSARCKNTYSTGDYGGEGRATYLRGVSGPSGYSFNMWRESASVIRATVSNSCGTGATLYGYFDVWAPSNWPWTNPNTGANEGRWGWRRDSYGWVGGLNYWADTINTGVTTSRSGGIPGGTQWRVAGHYTCQNSSTGRNSGGFVYGESGAYNF